MVLTTHRETLDFNLKLAKIFGLFGYYDLPLKQYLAIITFRTINIIMTTLVIVTNTADFFVNISNLSEVSYNIGYILPMTATSLKALTFFMRQKAVVKIIEEVHGPVTKLISSSDIGVVNLIKKSVFWQNVDFGMFVCATFCVCMTGLLPIRQILSTRQLMIRAVFPFDEKPYPIFEIVYALQYYGLLVECAWCVIFDPVVMGLARWITFQVDVLRSNFEHCDDGIPRATFVKIVDLEKERERQSDKNAKIKVFIPFSDDQANETNDSFLLRFCHCVIQKAYSYFAILNTMMTD
ncbi:hypothetical protein KQX54_002601 [Cotesia glomerata]|uniref:Odorant receptor n=1 Tax=Cotesia glomerata TaxID=32391 RepID=A0AAV7IJ39_COTGL|nr:hypothetical protein KQX54_002601 [Cotesia glomerata]